MISEPGTWPLFDSVIAPAARRVAPLLKQFGWDADDCAQEAAVWLMDRDPLKPAVLALPEAERVRYLAVAVRRHLVNAARYRKTEVWGRDVEEWGVLDRLATRFDTQAAVVEVADLLASAPEGDARDWLQARAADGLTWDEALRALGWSRKRAGEARTAAAAWLLEQFEGKEGHES